MFPRPFVLAPLLALIGLLGGGCAPEKLTVPNKLTVGIVSYGEQTVSLDKYDRFKDYLAQTTKSIVEIEPAYNEVEAIEQVNRKNWDVVFAPPGLAAIAMDKNLYIPLFSSEGVSSVQRCLLIVRDDSSIQSLADLGNKTIALGQPGSAAGYYMPLYDLYGLTLSEIRFAPTPKTALQWISEGRVDAGALSERDFERFQRDFSSPKLRILHTSRWIPPGLVLIGPNVDRNQQAQIEKAMKDAPADITSDAGYVPTASLPGYKQFIEFVGKVRPLEARVHQKPAVLIKESAGDPQNSPEASSPEATPPTANQPASGKTSSSETPPSEPVLNSSP